MNASLSELKTILTNEQVSYRENEPLKNHTTFKIGGVCDLLTCPRDEKEISLLITECKRLAIPYIIIGKGSNILASDEGFEGVVMKLCEDFSQIVIKDTILECEAGAPLSKVCYEAYEHGLTGLEFAWGIPGTIGGALFMNAGAYGGEMKDVVLSAEHIDQRGQLESFENEALKLSYRHSIYADQPQLCITKVILNLKHGKKADIKVKMDDLLSRRKSKQPLEYPSAGSTFKRPAGNYASALIEQCGLKGKQIGGARVSDKHSGFIINYQNASCHDVLELISYVQTVVKEKTGYQLDCEIRRI